MHLLPTYGLSPYALGQYCVVGVPSSGSRFLLTVQFVRKNCATQKARVCVWPWCRPVASSILSFRRLRHTHTILIRFDVLQKTKKRNQCTAQCKPVVQNRDIAWVSVWYRKNTTSKPHTLTHTQCIVTACVCVCFFLFSFSKLGQSKSVTQNTEQITVRKLGMHSRRVPGVLEFWNSIFYHVFFCILFFCALLNPLRKH